MLLLFVRKFKGDCVLFMIEIYRMMIEHGHLMVCELFYKSQCIPKTGISGAPDLVDRVFAVHAGSRGFDYHRLHMSERFFRPNGPGYPHQVCSELESSGIRVAVGDCSVTERRRWRPPYQTGKTVHVHANTLQT